MRDSGYERAANDWYVEPRWAVREMVERLQPEGVSWDPACGCGTIPEIMTMLGYKCGGSDLVDRAGGRYPQVDFFSTKSNDCDNIISNPPFSQMQRFVEHGLAI